MTFLWNWHGRSGVWSRPKPVDKMQEHPLRVLLPGADKKDDANHATLYIKNCAINDIVCLSGLLLRMQPGKGESIFK